MDTPTLIFVVVTSIAGVVEHVDCFTDKSAAQSMLEHRQEDITEDDSVGIWNSRLESTRRRR